MVKKNITEVPPPPSLLNEQLIAVRAYLFTLFLQCIYKLFFKGLRVFFLKLILFLWQLLYQFRNIIFHHIINNVQHCLIQTRKVSKVTGS